MPNTSEARVMTTRASTVATRAPANHIASSGCSARTSYKNLPEHPRVVDAMRWIKHKSLLEMRTSDKGTQQ
eukprot:9231363-Pyramimonas_sp.AAC.1